MDVPLADTINVTGAIRHDDYSDVGQTTNYRAGASWEVTSGVRLRGSYSTSFRAPSIGDALGLAGPGKELLYSYPFTSPSGGKTPVFVLGGKPTGLQPERARSWNFGIELRPSQIPGLRLELTAYDVRFRDRIVRTPFDTNALLHSDRYGSLLSPFSSPAAAQSYLDAFKASGGNFIDVVGTGATGVAYLFNNQTVNAAIVKQRGLDLDASYEHVFGRNKLTAGFNIAYIDRILTAYSPGATFTDLVNTFGNPLKVNLMANLTWERGPGLASVIVHYDNPYDNNLTVPTQSIGSYATVDMTLRMNLSGLNLAGSNSGSGATIGLNIVNLFDKKPPFASANGLAQVTYDSANASILGRYASVSVRVKW